MTDVTDKPKPVRKGEELDTGRLEVYLREHLPGFEGPLAIEQFPSGHSNLTYCVRTGSRDLVLRRPPFGSKVKSAHDMGREFRILSRLCDVYPPAPRPVAYCDDPAVLGAPFYIVERIRGIILRRSVPTGLDFAPEGMRKLSEAFVDNLATLHALDFRKAGLGDLGKPEGYNERQVTGWTKRYADSKTDDIPDVDRIAAWLAARIPPESGVALIHNDYKYDNIVLDPEDPTRIIGVLDWEMSTLGDPLMDLGTTLGYWTDPGDPDDLMFVLYSPTSQPGNLSRKELAARYAERTGHDVSNILFYYCYALFKTAVVIQQIYYRYKQGLTKDERFATIVEGVRILARQAITAAERGSM
jgi:aminoglycoside phosphotransferase (APT) family kinase protein